MVPESKHPGRWWHTLDDGRLQCDLCPRDCRLHEGQRGLCFVRRMEGGQMVLTTYGRSSGFCVDPIEKKPLNQFFPGSSVLSFGTAGCNLACKFCQNWDISKSREMDTLMDAATPEAIAATAGRLGCKSVAFTYNDPVIFAEYAIDTADACHAKGIQTVAVTAGYIHPEPRREFFSRIDAANVDLKAFTDDFYFKLTGAHLQPVLDTLVYLVKETNVWTEITTLLIPGKNDSDAEIEAECNWIRDRLGRDVPIVRLSNAQRQWGLCTAEGEIRYSWRLVHLAPELGDYVVAHEVAHLLEMNHSKRFWHLLESLYPDWREARARLEREGAGLPSIGRVS